MSKLTIEEFEREDDAIGVESEMDPPAFRKARLRSEQEEEIMREGIVSRKNKKIDFDDDLERHIPEEVIQKYSDEIAKKYEMASDRIDAIEEVLDVDEDDFEESNNTGKGELADPEEEDNSDIDERNIFLSPEQQEERRKKWEEYNKLWIDKQNAKEQRGENLAKKKEKQIKNEEKADNPFDAIMKDPVMESKVNKEELKRLFASQPKQPKK